MRQVDTSMKQKIKSQLCRGLTAVNSDDPDALLCFTAAAKSQLPGKVFIRLLSAFKMHVLTSKTYGFLHFPGVNVWVCACLCESKVKHYSKRPLTLNQHLTVCFFFFFFF